MLTNAGLPELIARDADEYLAIAQRLAQDLDALQALRQGLRARLQASPMMDAAGFTAALEAAYARCGAPGASRPGARAKNRCK